MRISEIEKADRPREKLKNKGAAALSDFELLQALIGSGNKQADVSQIARELNKLLRMRGADISYEEVEKITGLGAAKITELLAAFELSKRYLVESERPILSNAGAVVGELSDICDKKQEYFVCLALDGANRLIAKRTIAIGTLSASLIHPREVFADAITDRAASIIVAHNHPSGTLQPSEADLEITKRLEGVANTLGIGLLDHIIVAKSDYFSFADHHLINHQTRI